MPHRYFHLSVFYISLIMMSIQPEQAFSAPSIQLNNKFQLSEQVKGVEFSYYGDFMISYGSSGVVKVWSLKNDKLERTIIINQPISSLAVDRDQNWLAVGCTDGTVKILDFEHGNIKHAFKAHQQSVLSIAFSPNGKLLATGGKDKVIWLWNTKFADKLGYLKGHTGKVHTLSFGPRGQILYSASDDKTIRFWDVQAKKEIRNIHEESAQWGSLNDVDMSRYMDVIAEAITSVTRDTRSRRHAAGVPRWRYIIKLRNGITGEDIGELEGHKSPVTSVAISPNGLLAASASEDNTFRVWDTRSRRQITSIPMNAAVNSVRFSHNGHWVAVSDAQNHIQVYEVEQTGSQNIATADASQPRGGASSLNNHSGASMKGEKYAVVIGVGTYQNPRVNPLKYTDEDAKAFYDYLISPNGGGGYLRTM